MNDKKQNVLVVHNYYQIPGGEDIVVANEKKLLEDHGHKVVFYSRNNSELKGKSGLGKLLFPVLTIFNPRTYRDVYRLIREEQIQIVHVHNTLGLVSPAVYYAARRCHVPVVQTVHNFRLICPGALLLRDGQVCEECLRHGLGRAVRYGCYRGSKLQTLACVISTRLHRMTGIYGKLNYVCLTEFNRDKLLTLKQVKADRVFVKPNFSGHGERIVPFEERKNQFIFVGRIDQLKGIDLLLEAWASMGESAPRLIVCGTGPMEDWCREYIAAHGLTMVEMKGYVPTEEVKRMVGESLALILPTQCYEGFPMAIAEAFSVGTPVIGSDLGNVGSLIRENVYGWKFDHRSPQALREALDKVADRVEVVVNAFRRDYTVEKNYEILRHIYEQAQKAERR